DGPLSPIRLVHDLTQQVHAEAGVEGVPRVAGHLVPAGVVAQAPGLAAFVLEPGQVVAGVPGSNGHHPVAGFLDLLQVRGIGGVVGQGGEAAVVTGHPGQPADRVVGIGPDQVVGVGDAGQPAGAVELQDRLVLGDILVAAGRQCGEGALVLVGAGITRPGAGEEAAVAGAGDPQQAGVV